MKIVKPMDQGALIDRYNTNPVSGTLPCGAMCFRVAFKWAAGQVVGRELTYFDKGAMNIFKSVSKHNDYRIPSRKVESDPAYDFANSMKFGEWVANDTLQAMRKINEWGSSFSFAKQQFSGVNCTDVKNMSLAAYFTSIGDARKGGMVLVHGYYGKLPGNKPWGHAAAYSTTGGEPVYFDSNDGEFTFDSNEDIGAAIEQQIRKFATSWQGTLEEYRVFIIKPPA